MSNRTILGALTAVAVAGLASTASAQVDMKIGFATINDPQHAIAKEIQKRFAANKDIGINVRVFPAGQIGGIHRMIEGLQFGTLETMISPPEFLVGLNPAFQVPVAPGLFDNVEHAHRALNDPAFHEKFTNLAAGKGVRIASLYVYGPTAYASKKPIRKLADLKGLKVRVLATKMESALVGEFGAAGVPIDYVEVLPSLERGTIDAVRSSIIVMAGSKFFTVSKYITVTNDGMIPSAVLVSDVWLKKLSDKQREFVMSTLSGMTDWNTQTAIEYGKKAEQVWKDNGGEVIRLSDAEQKEMMDRLQPLGDQFLGTNPATKDMYALLKKAIERTRQ